MIDEQPMTSDVIEREAEAAWVAEVADAGSLRSFSGAVLVVSTAVGVATVVLLAGRMTGWLDGLAAVLVSVIAALLASILIALPLVTSRAAAKRAQAAIARARTQRRPGACTRCEAPLLARAEEEVGTRTCGGCAATLLEAAGLLIHHIDAPAHRSRRWRAAARFRLARTTSRRRPLRVSAASQIAATALSGCLIVASTMALLGETPPPGVLVSPSSPAPATIESPLGVSRTAAASESRAPAPIGPSSRPRATPWLGSQVFAPRGTELALAAVVEAESDRFLVVFGDGAATWVGQTELFLPEIAVADEVRVDGEDAIVIERVGPAVRLELACSEQYCRASPGVDRTQRWTDVSVLSVRRDSPHPSGRGLGAPLTASAWVEARGPDGAWRPGVRIAGARGCVGAEPGLDLQTEADCVVFSRGDVRRVLRDQVRAQSIAPGHRVHVVGHPGNPLVAARVGHAVVVVDRHGHRRWTAVSQITRAHAP